jgi:hypothetical protein
MMKNIMIDLLKRNGIIIATYAVAMVTLTVVPRFSMAAVWVMLFLMIGLIWANGMLVKHMSRLLAALLTAIITLIVGGGVIMLTIQVQQMFGKG